MARKKSKKKQKTIGSIVSGIIIFIIILLLLSFAGVVIKQHFYPEDDGVVVLTYDGKTLENGDSLGVIDSGAEFGVLGTGNYTVTVTAYHTDENDFEFKVGEEGGYSWHDVDDLTPGVIVEKKAGLISKGFTLTFSNLDELLTTVYGLPVTEAAGNAPTSDIFTLTVKGVNEVSITFGVQNQVEGIVLNPPNYVF